MVALNNRNTPPNSMIKSRPEKLLSNTSNSGCVRVTNHEILASRPRRISNARDNPINRARSRCSGGSLSARIAINTRLSMPSTSSSTIKVNRPSQAVGSANHSIFQYLFSFSECRARQRTVEGPSKGRQSEDGVLGLEAGDQRERRQRMSWGKTTGRLREGVHVGPVAKKGLESYRRNDNFLQRKIITRSVTGSVST